MTRPTAAMTACLSRRAPYRGAALSRLLPALLATTLLTGCVDTLRDALPGDPPPLQQAMSEDDVRLADATVQQALETALSGDTRRWRNATSGHAGSVTPQRTWRNGDGVYCRDFVETLSVGERTARYRDTHCRDAGGIWRPVR